jgi:hypothetical protein
MRITALLLAVGVASFAFAAPNRHLRYQREIVLPPDAAGQACVALDAEVFTHTASLGGGDIRIEGRRDQRGFEVPFALTESGPATMDTQLATVGNITVHNGELQFDLSMPAGEYTDVALNLALANFLGTARVSGVDDEGRPTPLGVSPIFDLSSQHLARSTVLPLPASAYPTLRVQLRLFTPDGQPVTPSAAWIQGASVPPSREAQTVYTTVASASAMQQQGQWSAATMTVGAHVPVERVRFALQPGFQGEFLRDATITATPSANGWEATGAAEGVSGHIFRVLRPASSNLPAIDTQALAIDTVIGANLRSPAKVTASIDNGGAAALPVERVDLEMRQRRICFDAHSGTTYTIGYGDADLSAPSYGYARHFVAAQEPIVAALGPELTNPDYRPNSAVEDRQERGRELPWVLLIAGVSVLGVIALQYVRYKRGESA